MSTCPVSMSPKGVGSVGGWLTGKDRAWELRRQRDQWPGGEWVSGGRSWVWLGAWVLGGTGEVASESH